MTSLPSKDDVILFRVLTVEDFRAPHPPIAFAHRLAHFGAVSCISITAPPELRIDLSGRSGVSTIASISSPRFIAAFDPHCSWWSPEPSDPRYALQHEQVHFAIAEHAARELTREMAAAGTTVRAIGADRDAAISNLREKLQSTALQAVRRASLEHDAFDSATSASPTPEVQLEWVRRYKALLADGN